MLNTFRSDVTNGNREWLLTTRVDTLQRQQQSVARFKNDVASNYIHGPINPIFNTQSNQPKMKAR